MIIITGSSGFIGSNFVNFFLKKKIKFYGLDKIKNPYIKFTNFSKIDLKNKIQLFNLFSKLKPKIVIHLAADSGLNQCHLNKEQAFENNLQSTFNLLLACEKYKCKKILLTSSMAATNYEKNPSFYAFTKIACENLFKCFRKNYNLNTIILRFSNIFGSFSYHKKSSIHEMLKCTMRNKTFKIHGTGKQERDFLYVEDLIKKTINIMRLDQPNLLYEIKSNKKYSINKIFLLIKKLSKKKIRSKKIKPPAAYDVSYNNLQNLKASKRLTLNLNKTINWYNSL